MHVSLRSTDVTGAAALGNSGPGVLIRLGASSYVVHGNVIAFTREVAWRSIPEPASSFQPVLRTRPICRTESS